jgi:hypothetical protein
MGKASDLTRRSLTITVGPNQMGSNPRTLINRASSQSLIMYELHTKLYVRL